MMTFLISQRVETLRQSSRSFHRDCLRHFAGQMIGQPSTLITKGVTSQFQSRPGLLTHTIGRVPSFAWEDSRTSRCPIMISCRVFSIRMQTTAGTQRRSLGNSGRRSHLPLALKDLTWQLSCCICEWMHS